MCFTTELASVLGTHGQQCPQIEASDTGFDCNGNVKVYSELSGKAKFIQINSVYVNKKQTYAGALFSISTSHTAEPRHQMPNNKSVLS